MIKTINIGAILLLIYYYNNIDQYLIQVYEHSRVSRTVVGILSSIPRPGIWLLVIMLVILVSLFIKTRWKYIGHILAVIVVDISIALILSELALESFTPYYIFEIYHPISIETKLEYLQKEIVYCYSQIFPELVKYSIDDLNIIKTNIENRIDTICVTRLNAQGLSEYARHLVTESFNYERKIPLVYITLYIELLLFIKLILRTCGFL